MKLSSEFQVGIENLGRVVELLVENKVFTSNAWRTFGQQTENVRRLEKLFAYERATGMPSLTALIKPAFHPSRPLIMFNYTKTAHALLHKYANGWTPTIRLCRGIVFRYQPEIKLVALPFPKFFNYGEHQETTNLPAGPYEILDKLDGHLGIIFWDEDALIVTTRGSFTSQSAVIGQTLLERLPNYLELKDDLWPRNITVLAEIIHPETRVYTDYHETEGLHGIGAMNTETLEDCSYEEFSPLIKSLGLPVVSSYTFANLEEVKEAVGDRSVRNREGFVVRCPDGRRVKLKFQSYIGLMVSDKLSYTYLMNRLLTGNLRRMVETLPEEVRPEAERMLGQILLALSGEGTERERHKRLYDLLPADEQTSYFKQVCRQLAKQMKISLPPITTD